MAAKQKGNNQKKRSQRQQSLEHVSSTSSRPACVVPVPVPEILSVVGGGAAACEGRGAAAGEMSPSSLGHAESFSSARSGHAEAAHDKAMQSRREFVFACLVGHRVTVMLRDGVEISGVFALHGNQASLPQTWGLEPRPSDASSPQPENAYVYVTALRDPTDILDESTGWCMAGRKKKPLKKQLTRLSEELQDDSTSSSSSLVGTSNTFELYHSEARTSSVKKPCLWLRCAYRTAGTTAKSSQVFDWLAIPWSDITSIDAENIPDNPDAYRSRSLLLGFHTDAEIARAGPMVERQLEKWDGGDEFDPGVLDETAVLSWPASEKTHRRGSTGWDQFECNAKKFGIQSTYVEGMYSTDLDVNSIPEDYQKHAEKIADEVENSNGRRLRGRHTYRSDEEEDADDEEARFSAVAGTGRYAGKVVTAPRGGLNLESAKIGPRRAGGRGRGRTSCRRTTWLLLCSTQATRESC